jgi:hypothetical protein
MLGALLAVVAAPSATAQVPRSFWGVIPIGDPSVAEFERMGRANVGTLRLFVSWPDVEPSPDNYDWSGLDFYVANLAANGIELLPFPYGTPSWAGAKCGGLDAELCERVPPLTKQARAAWIDFLQQFVARYGPQGTFWSDPTDAYDPPYLPVTRVQPWNEPSSQTYFRPRPKPKKYGTLVKISHDAIAAVDPTIQIVLAGVFPSPELGKQFRFTKFLEILYDVKGIKKKFDIAAFHPYARTVQRLANQIKKIRKLMKKGGVGGKPLWITELGWGSAEPFENRPLIKGIEGQRLLLEQSFQLLEANAAKWKLAGVVWYSFRDPGYGFENCPFCESAGLFDVDGNPKPAWFSFAQRTGGSAE